MIEWFYKKIYTSINFFLKKIKSNIICNKKIKNVSIIDIVYDFFFLFSYKFWDKSLIFF